MSAKGTPWFKCHTNVRHHIKVKRLAKVLGIPIPHALGHLMCMWAEFADMRPDGDLSDVSGREIEEAAQWIGEEGAFYHALVIHRFIDVSRHRKLPAECTSVQLGAFLMQLGAARIHNACAYNAAYERATVRREERKRAKERRKEAKKATPKDVGSWYDSGTTVVRQSLREERRGDLKINVCNTIREAAAAARQTDTRRETDESGQEAAHRTRSETSSPPADVGGPRGTPLGLGGPGDPRAEAEQQGREDLPAEQPPPAQAPLPSQVGAVEAAQAATAELHSLAEGVGEPEWLRPKPRPRYCRASLEELCGTLGVEWLPPEQLSSHARAQLDELGALEPWAPRACLLAVERIEHEQAQPTLSSWIAALHAVLVRAAGPVPGAGGGEGNTGSTGSTRHTIDATPGADGVESCPPTAPPQAPPPQAPPPAPEPRPTSPEPPNLEQTLAQTQEALTEALTHSPAVPTLAH